MNCSNCGSELKENQKFCNKCGTKINIVSEQQEQNKQIVFMGKNFSLPVIVGISFLASVLIIVIIHLKTYTEVSIEKNNQQEQTEQKVEIIAPKLQTAADKLSLIDEYQAKYFRIIRRNDFLLQMEYNSDCLRDMDELEDLFREVKENIANNYYLNKYNEIEERFSENPGETTIDMNIFASQNFDAVDGLLNEVYQAVKAKIPQEDFKNLVADEINWLKDVESYKKVFDSKDFGSAGSLIYTNYEINMRSFRTLLLMLYL